MIRKTMLAAALLACGLMATTDAAQAARVGGVGHGFGAHGFRGGLQQRSFSLSSPSLASPPPQQQQLNFVSPAPSLGTPMQRVPQVAPLAAPPLR